MSSACFRCWYWMGYVGQCRYKHTRQRFTNLSHDQVLRELGKSNHMIKQLLLLPVVIRPLDQLEGIIQLENLLVAGFVPVRLANDLGRIGEKRCISSPGAIPNVCVQ